MLLFKRFVEHRDTFKLQRGGVAPLPVLLLLLIFLPCVDARALSAPVGIILAAPSGEILYEKNSTTRLVPASTLKVLTALCALETLGPAHRFSTRFFLDRHAVLIMKGGGDPLLTSRELKHIAGALEKILRRNKISRLGGMVVDTSSFAPDITIPGTGRTLNPYDATVGAVGVNFNTVSFKKDSRGRWRSGETETPLIPLAEKWVARTGMNAGRIPIPRNGVAQYAGHLLKWFLEKEGIAVEGEIHRGKVSATAREIFTWKTPVDLCRVVEKLLRYSNNFMANQLFLTMGGTVYGLPATLGKGRKVIQTQMARLGAGEILIAEGSGISRQNRISPREMLTVLNAFSPHHELMQHENGSFYKTGTLEGVRTRCGYFQGSNGGLFPFVVMINKKGLTCDDVVKRLQKKVDGWTQRHAVAKP